MVVHSDLQKVVTSALCPGCDRVITPTDGALCSACQAKAAEAT